MPQLSWMRSYVLVIFLVAQMLPVRGAVADDILNVKIGFGHLTQQQEVELWKQLDIYALSEAALHTCGRPSDLEQRLVAATKDCVDLDLLKAAANYFRGKVREQSALMTSRNCGNRALNKALDRAEYLLDEVVEEASRMCRSCRIC